MPGVHNLWTAVPGRPQSSHPGFLMPVQKRFSTSFCTSLTRPHGASCQNQNVDNSFSNSDNSAVTHTHTAFQTWLFKFYSLCREWCFYYIPTWFTMKQATHEWIEETITKTNTKSTEQIARGLTSYCFAYSPNNFFFLERHVPWLLASLTFKAHSYDVRLWHSHIIIIIINYNTVLSHNYHYYQQKWGGKKFINAR